MIKIAFRELFEQQNTCRYSQKIIAAGATMARQETGVMILVTVDSQSLRYMEGTVLSST